MEVRLVGAIEADQTEHGKTERNDRLLGVAIHSYNHERISSIADIGNTRLKQIEESFVDYNQLRGKKFKVKKRTGPKGALRLIEEGIAAFQKKKG